jgi:hypothetical protein
MATTLCSCGSGRTFDRCHGDPANEFARVQALAEARHVAALFPAVRPRSEEVLAFAATAAAELRGDDEPSEELLDEGVQLVAAREWRTVVDSMAAEYPDRWASLTHAAADTAAAERELVKGAIEPAIAESQATPRTVLRVIERKRPRPAMALALVVPPPFVWSIDDAHVAETAARGRSPREAMRAFEEVAAALERGAHTARVRALTALVAAELPVPAMPRASRLLAEAVERVDDILFVRAVLALTLGGYVAQLPPDGAAASQN